MKKILRYIFQEILKIFCSNFENILLKEVLGDILKKFDEIFTSNWRNLRKRLGDLKKFEDTFEKI